MNRSIFFSCLFLLLFITGNSYGENDSLRSILHGKELFRELCSTCHGVHREITGPMLASIPKKKKEQWLIAFIRNSQEVIKSGDPYAVHLFEQYQQHVMPPFKHLSDKEIKDILFYIQTESLYPTESLLSDLGSLQKGNTDIMQGQALFEEHCSYCHFIDKESYYAPALGSVTKRHTEAWLTGFIQHSTKVIASGDPYAKDLFNAYNQRVMVPMEFLQKKEIQSILAYIEFTSASHEQATGGNGKKIKDVYETKSTDHSEIKIDRKTETEETRTLLFALLLGIGIILFLLILCILYLKRRSDEHKPSS